MLEKCCNPKCDAPFDYREGRLVRISRTLSNGQPGNYSLIEHFWLCGNCSEHYVLDRSSEMKIQIKPREQELFEKRSFHCVAAD